MAIIQSCCWWNNVTYGSYGSAVYSFLVGGIFTILVMFDVRPFHFFGTAAKGPAINMGSYLQIVSGLFLCISALCLVAGVYRCTKQLLLPWIISMLLFTVILITGNVHLCLRKYEMKEHAGADALVIVVSVVFALLNIYGGLCVVSLYQILSQDSSKMAHGINKDILPEKASISYFKRGSYDPSISWANHITSSVVAVDRAAPPTVTIHRECQLRSSLQIPEEGSLRLKTCILPKKNLLVKQTKQVRIQAPDRLQKC